MDFDNKVLETLAHLDHAPTPPTIDKISPILSSSKSLPQQLKKDVNKNAVTEQVPH